MRRFFVVLAGLGIVSSGLACHHIAGKCDCNPITPPCAKYGLYTSSEAAVVHHAAQPVRESAAPGTPAAGETLPPAPMPAAPNAAPPAPAAPAPGSDLLQ